jgi:hypothetical protein
MDSLSRLIRSALLALLVFGSVAAQAIINYEDTVYYRGSSSWPTPAEACAAASPRLTVSAVFKDGTKPSRRYSCQIPSGSEVAIAGEGCPSTFSWVVASGRCEKVVSTCPAPKVYVAATNTC